MSKRKSIPLSTNENIKRRNKDKCGSIFIQAQTTTNALEKIGIPSERRKRPNGSRYPKKMISWIQAIGCAMHKSLGIRDDKYTKCVTSEEKPLMMTIPDPVSQFKSGTSGIFIPKVLAKVFEREEYIVRYVCMISLKMSYKKDKGASIEITHMGTVPVCKLVKYLKNFDPECSNDDIEDCLTPWGMRKLTPQTRKLEWYYIPWGLVASLLPIYQSEELSNGMNEEEDYSRDDIIIKVVDGIEHKIKLAGSDSKDGIPEGNYIPPKLECIHPIVLKNGWNEDIQPPKYKSDTFWSLSDDIKDVSDGGFTPIFALDKCETNKKLFLSTTYHSLWKMIKGDHRISGVLDRSHICAHSVVRNHYACKAFWDFECNEPKSGWPEPMEDLKVKLMDSVIILIKTCFYEVFSIKVDKTDFLIFEACKSTKISFHVILATPGLFFSSFMEMKKFMRILECFIIRILTYPGSDNPMKKHVSRLLLPPKDDTVSHSGRALDSVIVSREEKRIQLACFWDMGASDKTLAFFRTPMSTKFAEDRPLLVSPMNEFVPDEHSIQRKMTGITPSQDELYFLHGLPTAVCVNSVDERDESEVGLSISEDILRKYAHDVLTSTDGRFTLVVIGFGECKNSSIDLKGISELIPSSFGKTGYSNASQYSRRQKSYRGSWSFYPSVEKKGLTEMLKSLVSLIPSMGEWSHADSFDYCVLFRDDKISKDKKRPKISGIMIKNSASFWCPIKKGNHAGRRGNAKVMIKRGSGDVAMTCFSSHCGKIEHKGILRGDDNLGVLFRYLESK